ncbi:MAG: nucleotidyl transferase AbiEii/AbiGii toxin family protein [Spirochaeta sp.]|jgi:predicted nucleotidyltransferase component of viral defense system|nr:nucleotidyl transferase AbiEii/AbiGii toxin family protein [Spirochaeta sp.]
MSIRMIQERFQAYSCTSEQEEEHALREITQEVILAALSRHGFFGDALFQGGTCLRIFHGLNRFSEDLGFILKEPDPDFDLLPFLNGIGNELDAYGYRVEITDRSSSASAVRKAFIKDDSLGRLVSLSFASRSGPLKKIRVKLEVDVNPPSGSGTELRYQDFPFLASVAVQDRASLFAGKIHALLCREYIKGRDWYDFLWYTAQHVEVNYRFLSSALMQAGPWQGETLHVDAEWVQTALIQAIEKINWKETAIDVRRFVPASEQTSLDLWSRELFLEQVRKIG